MDKVVKMKEEILNNLAGLIEYVKQGADFVKEQAPLYVQELISYGIWVSIFEMILCVLGVIGGTIGLVKLVNYVNNEEEYDADAAGIIAIGFMALVVLIIFCIVAFCVDGENLIQATVAPRVYVVEKLMSICK